MSAQLSSEQSRSTLHLHRNCAGNDIWNMTMDDLLYIGEASVSRLNHHGSIYVNDGTATYKRKSEAEKVTSIKKDEEHF